MTINMINFERGKQTLSLSLSLSHTHIHTHTHSHVSFKGLLLFFGSCRNIYNFEQVKENVRFNFEWQRHTHPLLFTELMYLPITQCVIKHGLLVR